MRQKQGFSDLDKIKREVNLPYYLQEKYGYEISKKESSKNSIKLYGHNDTLVAKRADDGNWLYMNVHNKQDRGSVFDFKENRDQDYSFKGAVKELEEHIGQVPSERIPQNLQEVEPSKKDLENVVKEHRKLLEHTDRSFLIGRGIPEETLDSKIADKRIFNDKFQTGGKVFTNTAFPMYGVNNGKIEVMGLSKRNDNFRGVAQGSDRSSSVWVGGFDKNKEKGNLVVSEDPVDSLSYPKLQGDPKNEANDIHVATVGSPTKRQTELVSKISEDLKPKGIVLANDNDAPGQKANCQIMADLDLKKQDIGVKSHDPMLRDMDIDCATLGRNDARVTFSISHEKGDIEKEAPALTKIRDHFQEKNRSLQGEISHKEPFKVETSYKPNNSKVNVEFSHTKDNWHEMSKSVHELKHNNTQKLSVHRPISKDLNQDLKNEIGMEQGQQKTAGAKQSQGAGIASKLAKNVTGGGEDMPMDPVAPAAKQTRKPKGPSLSQ